MKIEKAAVAGSMESNDAMISIEPGDGKLEIQVDSVVIRQFGEAIYAAIRDTAAAFDVTDARVTVRDKGAVECTLRARMETAILRAAGKADA